MKTIVISLGGSIIVPDKIAVPFLKDFRSLILKFLRKGLTFVVVAGGGSVARQYIKAGSAIAQISNEDKDWLGIHATRINAQLLKAIFGKRRGLHIASTVNWKPGCSTDYRAVILAKRFRAARILNCSNIDYVYNKDISKYNDAKPIKAISWPEYLKIIPAKWQPGMKTPFDPIAGRLAQKYKMEVVVTRGTDLKNLEKILTNKSFKGTTIYS